MRFLLGFMFLLVRSVSAQEIVFNMSAFGVNFGKMTITKVKENDSTEFYTLIAKGYLKVLWLERNDETKHQVRYCNGKLIFSSYVQIENGVTKRWTNISNNGKEYLVNSYRGKRTFGEAPVYSIMSLYFSEPKNIQRIFHEAESEYISLKHTNGNTVEVSTSDGNKSIYRFSKGVLNEIEFHISVATVYARRAN